MDRRYRKTLIAGNWKMNGNTAQIREFAEMLKGELPPVKWCDVLICTPFVLIPAAVKSFRGGKFMAGAQDVSLHETGAYTGEVSAGQLADIGAKYVIIGHSERRAYHGESNEDVRQKTQQALGANLTPIVCVGESLEEREMGITLELVTLQVKTALAGLEAAQVRKLVIAYEPVWAIGTGKTATAQEANEVCAHIRGVIRNLYGARLARGVSILYGGSMNAKNAAELLAQRDIDGGLIGGASLKATEFAQIILAAKQ